MTIEHPSRRAVIARAGRRRLDWLLRWMKGPDGSDEGATMMARRLGLTARLGLVGPLMALVWLASPGTARAQFGIGFGFGFMDRPMSVENIYSRANMEGSYAYGNRQQNLPAPAWVRDLGYSMRNNVESRNELEARVAAERRQRPQSQTAPAAAPPTPHLPLVGFFDEYGKLVWPAEAPYSGDLKEKRD